MANKAEIAKKLQSFVPDFDERKNVEPKVGGKQLSGSIRGGVAKINKGTKIDVNDKGVAYAIISGSCLHPEEDKGARVAKLYYFSDQPWDGGKSAADIFDDFLNDLVLIGVDVAGCKSIADIPTVVERLTSEAPVVEFNTGRRQTDKKTGELRDAPVFWQGLAEDDDAPFDPSEATIDNTPEASDLDIGSRVVCSPPGEDPWTGEVSEFDPDGETVYVIYDEDNEIYAVNTANIALEQ